MTKERSEFKLIAPMALIVLAAVCALVGSLWVWAEQTDRAARVREENLVRAGIQNLVNESSVLLNPMAIWDEAVRNTDHSYNHQWVQNVYGDYMKNILGFELAYLLDDQNTPVFASRKGKEIPARSYNGFSTEARSILLDVRKNFNPQTRKLIQKDATRTKYGKLIRVNGRVYAFGAALISTDRRSQITRSQPFVIMGGREISASELTTLADSYALSHVRMLRPGQTALPGSANVIFNDDAGSPLLHLSWMPETPGRKLFIGALGPVLLVSLGLGAVAVLMLHQSQRAARSLIASEAKAKHMALHDNLTGLPNRTLFADRLTQATERVRRLGGNVAVFCIGLDRFKDVNDTLGHQAGDELIRNCASRISSMIRAGDTLARLGGDEFVIIQTDTDGHSASALAKRIQENLTGTVTLDSGQVFCSCSIGVTLISDADVEPAEALRQADLALYRAKELGRGQYAFFELEMDATIKLRKMLETGLREAIHCEEIDVVYQPQVDHFGTIVGVEALARWTHRERGPISPGYFIPLAEECNLMIDLGAVIMRRAMMDSHRWPGLKVAVNVSATQLRGGQFIPRLKEMMQETGVSATRIEIEITEGVLLNDDHQTQIILKDLRSMGFTIALDDFGTGYSSLSYLGRYPVDKIKIDRSFVSNLGVDAEADAVIRAIVKLAKALHLNIVAEGVETKQQRSILKQAGCPIIQGFLFSKPVKVEEIDALLAVQVAPPVKTRIQTSARTTTSVSQSMAMMK